MLPYAETRGLRFARSLRCTTSSKYAWNITACWERPTRSVAIYVNWKLQDQSFAKCSLWPALLVDQASIDGGDVTHRSEPRLGRSNDAAPPPRVVDIKAMRRRPRPRLYAFRPGRFHNWLSDERSNVSSALPDWRRWERGIALGQHDARESDQPGYVSPRADVRRDIKMDPHGTIAASPSVVPDAMPNATAVIYFFSPLLPAPTVAV